MSEAESLIVAPGPRPGTFRLPDGRILAPPAGWSLLPPGDAALTRKVKAAGPTWTVQEKRGRKLFSRGVWAPEAHITAAQAEVEATRQTDAWQRRQEQSAARRERVQGVYVEDFNRAVLDFLAFHPRYVALAVRFAEAVTAHATPVGSGTVARTERIPIEERAEAAVIAWMRHQTTAYDNLAIPRVKGKRREVRAMLAQQSRRLLERYRQGDPTDADTCPLQRALPPRATPA